MVRIYNAVLIAKWSIRNNILITLSTRIINQPANKSFSKAAVATEPTNAIITIKTNGNN
jgi:hypothetical protein